MVEELTAVLNNDDSLKRHTKEDFEFIENTSKSENKKLIGKV
jgi:hypothetical protein